VTQTLTGGNRKDGGYSYDDLPLTTATFDASFAKLQGASGQDLNHGHSHLVFGGNNTGGAIKVHPALNAAKSGSRRMDFETEAFIFQSKQSVTQGGVPGPISPSLDKSKSEGLAVFAQNTRDEVREMNVVGALSANPGMKQTSYLRQYGTVRRITPMESERLQGFPDDYTNVIYRGKPAADGPRYKAIGNSMAVPVMKWIGERIDFVDKL